MSVQFFSAVSDVNVYKILSEGVENRWLFVSGTWRDESLRMTHVFGQEAHMFTSLLRLLVGE